MIYAAFLSQRNGRPKCRRTIIMSVPEHKPGGFLKIAQHENELRIDLPLGSAQKTIGWAVLILSSAIAPLYLLALLGVFSEEKIEDLLLGIVAMIPPGLVILFFLVASFRMAFDKIFVTINSETITKEKNGFFRRRKWRYPRSEILRIDRNLTKRNKYDSVRPTVEIIMPQSTFVLICRDAAEQQYVETLLRNALATELAADPSRGFRTKIEERPDRLRILQPPERRLLFDAAVIVGFYGILITGGLVAMIIENRGAKFMELLLGSLVILTLFGWVVLKMLHVAYGQYAYTFSSTGLLVEYRCLFFQRRRSYPLQQLQNVEQDYIDPEEQARIERTVSIVTTRRRIRIAVASVEEQHFLAQKIDEFLEKHQNESENDELLFESVFLEGLTPPPKGSFITLQNSFEGVRLRIPIRSIEKASTVLGAIAQLIVLGFLSVFTTSLVVRAILAENLLGTVLFGFLAFISYTSFAGIAYMLLWRGFGTYFVELGERSFRIQSAIGPIRTGVTQIDYATVTEIRSPDPAQPAQKAQQLFGAKYVVELHSDHARTMPLPCRFLEEQTWLAGILQGRLR